ncbi:MAG: MerR family transcriptional regulator [Acidobacteriia bacterium]|nr:MerR family transcriptional regulator [Terriglobia bacterium]
MHRIIALKDLGFPLDRIAPALDKGISADVLRGMLMLRQVEQEERLREESERLARLNGLLRLIDQEGVRAGEVVLKEVAAQQIVSIRDVIPSYRDVGSLFERLYQTIGPLAPQGVALAIWHDAEYNDRDLDVEAGVSLKQAAQAQKPAWVRELAVATVASFVHHGAFRRISEAYVAILHWIDANQYQQAGPMRELFLRVSVPVSRDDESNVTEIQVPIGKDAK